MFPLRAVPRPPRRLEGIGLMVLAAIAFGAMGALIKVCGRLPVFELVLLRSLFAFLAISALFAARGRVPRLVSPGLLVARSVCGMGAMACYFYAIAHLDLATANVLNKSAPVFVVMFAWLVPGERPPRGTGALVLVALAGCAILLDPDPSSAARSPVPGLVGAFSAILSALAYTSVRQLGRTDGALDIVFYFTLVCVVLSIPTLALASAWPTRVEWMAMAGAGSCAAAGQVLMTKSYQVERAAVVSPYNYASVLVAAALGYVVWGEVPRAAAAVGVLLLVAAGAGIGVLRAREA